MSEHDCKGCQEYKQLSRRHFLGMTGGLLTAAALPGWLPRVVLADSHSSSRDVLVSIFLRGGADSLSLCVPHQEASYYQLRPNLAIPPPDSSQPGRSFDLDGFFGFPPALEPLLEAYQDGALAVVHACGLENTSRSHFDAMHFMEVGQERPPADLFTGWLGRHLQATAPTLTDGFLRAVGIGFGLPRSLVGGPRTMPIQDFTRFGFGGDIDTLPARQEALEAMYAAVPDPLGSAARNTFGTVELLKQIDFAGYQPTGGAAYPEGEFGTALRSAAALIKAEVGVEAIAVDLGGWDTHDFQGPLDGQLAAVMGSFADGLAAFHKDLWSAERTDVTVVAMSEFGRNAFENGSAGTDHGHGGAMFALGGNVAGGRVITEWPGLAPGQLFEEQDLAITIDYRDVLTEVLTKRLENPDFRTVFGDPSFTPTDRGVIG